MLISEIVKISENRQKAKELTTRSNKKNNEEGKSFAEELEEAIKKNLERR